MKSYVLNAIGYHKIKNVTNLVIQRELFDPLIKVGFNYGHVIVTYAGDPIGERYLKRIIDLICERENILHFTPHYLRHTFVSIQLSNNVPITTVAALVGDTPETIYKIYAHSFEKDEIQASNIMDEIISLNPFNEIKK